MKDLIHFFRIENLRIEILSGPLFQFFMAGMVSAAGFRALALEFNGLLESYTTYKREAALLDFDDLLLTARELLRDNDPLRRALAHRYTHVLVFLGHLRPR